MDNTLEEYQTWQVAKTREPHWEKWYGFQLRISEKSFVEVCKFDDIWYAAHGYSCRAFKTLAEALRYVEIWYYRRFARRTVKTAIRFRRTGPGTGRINLWTRELLTSNPCVSRKAGGNGTERTTSPRTERYSFLPFTRRAERRYSMRCKRTASG
jgi:hypothetical protein